jgi:glycosyltransferase involved in cell wall biosynthesis
MIDKPMHFCMVTTFYPPYNFGGDGIFVKRLANELARRGHRIDVVHCRDAYRLMAGGEADGGYDDHPNVTVHGLETPWGFLSPLAVQQTGRPLFKTAALRRIFAQPFDVIHFHNISLFGPKILEYGDSVKLYTMHEYWLVCPMHTLYRFNRSPCDRPLCFACTLAYMRPPQLWRYSRMIETAARHVNAFIAPSRFIENKHREMGFEAPIVHLPYFVPEPAESAAAFGQGNGDEAEPYFMFVGRLEKLKGVETLIPIFRRYPRARLLIAGSGNDESRLRRLGEGSENIRFLGRLSDAELQPLVRGAVALIVPSVWFENAPIVILEAFRQGTPVIVRDLGAMPEMVNETGGGLVYRTDDDLLRAMDKIFENRETRRSLGQKGFVAYQQIFSVDAHMHRYFALIRELAARRSRAIGSQSPVPTT